jgi:hypothetical protein
MTEKMGSTRAAWAALVVAALAAILAPARLEAEERMTLGWGRMFNNDALGDGADRWRTGGYTVSRVRGQSWTGELPSRFGEILEFRARAEIIAPENLTTLTPGDRRYAGILSFGIHTHFQMAAGIETSVGMDLAITGRQSGMSRLQDALHDLFDFPRPRVASDQIGNGFHPTLVLEAGHSFDLGAVTIRPFTEAQAGLETFVRAGADLSFGRFGDGALMLRDHTTGQRYRGVVRSLEPGVTFTLGGDIAHVFDSELLPDGEPVVLEDSRSRLRAGLAWQGERAAVFYGVTWLGREFQGQREDQVVGSLNLRLDF